MPVPMMHVRIMRVAMGERLMRMFMNVRLSRINARRMFVLMMLIMSMPVTMHEVLMGMFMRMSLCQIQPPAQPQETHCRSEVGRFRLYIKEQAAKDRPKEETKRTRRLQ